MHKATRSRSEIVALYANRSAVHPREDEGLVRLLRSLDGTSHARVSGGLRAFNNSSGFHIFGGSCGDEATKRGGAYRRGGLRVARELQ